MTALTLLATGKLTASLDDRTLTGMLLPFDEVGRTNLGRLTASADSMLDLADIVPLTIEHDDAAIVGKAVAIEATGAGLVASFTVLPTPAGDTALLEASEGLRASLSVEVEPITTREGRIVSGTVSGASLVAKPAFPGAKLTAAEDGPVPDLGNVEKVTGAVPEVVIDGEELDDVKIVEVTPERITVVTTKTPEPSGPAEPKEPAMTAALVQNAALLGAAPKKTDCNALFAAFADYGRTRMEAALSDVVPANILGQSDTQPQYVRELWSGKAYERRVVPLLNHADLTSFTVAGWRWSTKPAVAEYAGNKQPIPSAPISTVAVQIDATRIAGGHDIDRKYRDFGNAEFWESYFKAMTESYAKVSDAIVLTEVLDAATEVTPGTVPAGVAPGFAAILDGALAILNATDTAPDFALVAPDLWRDMALTQHSDALEYLNIAIGLEDGGLGNFTIRPFSSIPDGQVLVGCKPAVTVHELGGSPIRVEALDIAKAGVDEALFGYLAVNVHDADGLALVETA
ncbi:MAG: hypothetical protein QM582_14045 [Micropruina sp.]|uniref:phage major capsid protein n=1 Tax=Micropruina sp. TaxID=2737536 RepID=UPI0039E71C5B